ncbi:hypothetical protein, partial [Caballeronia sp. LZ024]|uniref:hypothetical protein n=1 Tax=Caballeronia sp. LZ024 TaxID=3038561 RepID=UPI00285CA4BA
RMEFRLRPALPFVRMRCLLTHCAPRFGFAHCTGALLRGAHFSGILSVPCFEIPPAGGIVFWFVSFEEHFAKAHIGWPRSSNPFIVYKGHGLGAFYMRK